MAIALRELVRRPGRFTVAAAILSLIAVLVIFLGGLLDGLIGRSTGAIRAQEGDVLVYSDTARNSFLRSRIGPEVRAEVEAVPGVTQVGGLGLVQLGARLPDRDPRDLLDVALFGYELPPRDLPAPPPAGEGYADRFLAEQGVEEGMTLLLGPARSPVTVVGFVSDTNYAGQGSLWAAPETWRAVADANRPEDRLPSGTFQTLVVSGVGGAANLAAAIDDATGGATDTLGIDDAADSLPGVSEQRGVFNQIIGVTVAVAIVVVALFFALLTVERQALYGVLKAIGASSGTLFVGLVAQAVAVTAVAATVGASLAFLLDAAIPAGSVPLDLSVSRAATSIAFLLLAAVVGCAFSLRRVLRVDPASAIGSAA